MTSARATENIGPLWAEHRSARFPAGVVGEIVAGVDVTSLDTFTAGCIDTFVKTGKLDLWRTAILGLCHRDLAVAVLSQHGAEKEYFSRLELLARLVLEAVRDAAKEV